MSLWSLPAQSAALTPFAFLLGGLLCALVWYSRIAQILALAVCAAIAAGLAAILSGLPGDAVLSWAYADWAPGARSGLRLDALSGPLALLIASTALLSGLLTWKSGADGRAAVVRLAWAGAACGAAFSTDWLEASAWLTGAGLALSALIALQADIVPRAAAWAGRVFVWQALAGGTIMLGLGLVFANSGGLEPDRVGVMLDGARHDPLAFVGVALVSTGLAAFAGLAPLHGGGAGASSAVGSEGALIIMASGLVGFSCFLRIEGAFLAAWGAGISVFLLGLGALGACWAASQMATASALRAVALLAWSSQLGIALISVVAHEPYGAVLHILASTLAVSALLMGAHGLEGRFGPLPISRLHGLGRRSPIAGGAIVIAMLSLTGAPFTVGFVSRFAVMEAVIAGGGAWAAIALTLTSLLGMWVAARLIQILFLNAPDGRVEGVPARLAGGWVQVPVTLLLGLACVYFGLAQPPAAVGAPAALLERPHGR